MAESLKRDKATSFRGRDQFSVRKRSEIMRKIRSRNTRLDRAMKELLSDSAIGFQQYPKIFGNPDFLVQGQVVVFCDSGFWHGRNWNILRKKLETGSNGQYWVAHIRKNRARDREVNRTLHAEGWVVLRFWDTDIFSNPSQCVGNIRAALGKSTAE